MRSPRLIHWLPQQPAPKHDPDGQGCTLQAWLRGTIQKLPASSTVTNWRSVEKDPLGSILVEPASVPLLAPLLAAQQPGEAQLHKPSNGGRPAAIAASAHGSLELCSTAALHAAAPKAILRP